ncbi:acyl-CoA thioester hydrolase/BAAT C-terminal domain-containing protein [Phenylobacterium sp.]|uniref:acyl-CoA thioester hydrolase/BAAT C-terminal domain-containing protein n=1 Tax=Phenylobacterium sp. TaxID=1871053 RepID=UPI003563D9AA
MCEPGLVAELFAPEDARRRPAMMALGGSEGGLQGARILAAALAMAGFPTLAVAYFNEVGLPDALEAIPLETFGRALAWLAAQDSVDADRIGVVGASKGAEAALQFASRWPQIKAVVVGAATHVGWQGINRRSWARVSSWTHQGRELPFVAYRGMPNPFASLGAFYAKSLAAADNTEAATIPVEAIGGPVLLVSGGRDSMWDASQMSRAVTGRLDARGFTHRVVHLDYPDAGHLAFGAPIPLGHPARRMLGRFGGSVSTNAAAREDSWPRIVAFLKEVLGA